MKVNLDTLDEAAWFEWKGGVRVLIRPLSVSKTRELKKKATKKAFDFSKGRKERIEKLDEEKYNRLLQEHIVSDWENIYDQNGHPLPCNPETKAALLDHFHDLRAFCIASAQEFEDYQQEKTEEEEKNFSG